MSVFSSLWVPKSVTDAAEEIGADLADGDEVLVYDLSAAADKKSLLSRVWTYISSKLSSYTGALSANQFSLTGNITTTAWTTAGVRHKNMSATLTDTSSSGTVAAAYSNVFGGNTIAANNATVYTNYSTFYVAEPNAGANVTFTNKYALLTNGTVGASALVAYGSDEPTYGAELLTSAGWTVNSGWTESPDDTFAHTSGTDTLTHSATIANATKYQLSYTITGRTAGTITITVGGATTGAVSATGTFGPTTSSTNALIVTPTTDFNGTCVFSLKAITAVSTPRMVIKNASGTTVLETRTSGASNAFVGVDVGRYCTTGISNVGMGVNAQRSLTTGSFNVGMGYQAQYSLTTGSFNVGMGVNAQYSITTGSYNVGMGYQAQYSLTTGSFNVGMGESAQRSLTTGSFNVGMGESAQRSLTTGNYNVGMGVNAQYSITTGSFNVGMGYQAGRYQADGATALTDPEYSIYIGTNARGKDNADENSVVIGGNTPIGLGANTTVIGTSATTLTRLFGDITTGTDTASAAIHAIKTTEQLRLGYDATKYVAHTVDSSGNVLIDAVGVVKIGEASNHVQIATDGTLTLVGTATAWDDLMIPGHSVKLTGASPPDLLGGFAGDATLDLYAFDGGSTMEQVFFTVQMPHRWKQGSTIYPHVHVSPTSTNTGDTNERVIRFSLEYTWANIGDTFGATATLNLDSDAFVPNTSLWKHLLCKNATGIDGTGKTLSSMLVCRLFRDPADAVDTYPQDVAFLQFDIHYEIDSMGSSSEYTK